MVFFSWERKRKIPNTNALVENVRLRGGSIVQYDRIESVLVVCDRSARFEWVGPGESRRMAGVKHALYCALLGWWSPMGLIATPVSVVVNLRGGIDVTESFVEPDGIVVKAGVTRAEEQAQDRVRTVVMAVAFLAVIGLAIYLSQDGNKAH